jgi:hypothetical protein
MTPGVLLQFQTSGWSLRRCESCKIVFALPPGQSDVEAIEILREAMERHVKQNHASTFPSDWKAEHQSR